MTKPTPPPAFQASTDSFQKTCDGCGVITIRADGYMVNGFVKVAHGRHLCSDCSQ